MHQESLSISVLLTIASTLVSLVIILLIIAVTTLYQKKQIAFYAQIEVIKSENEKELLRSQLEIQEKTFEKISQEVHDNIGQEISIAKLYLNTLNKYDPADVDMKTSEASQLLTKVMDDVRNLSKYLNSNIIQTTGLTEVIKGNLQQIEKSGKYSTSFNIEGELKYLDESKEFAVFRIFQEAINNIIKHAKANHISVTMNYSESDLSVMIADNGSGFSSNVNVENKSYLSSGLINMQKRATLIGADYRIDSSAENGTVIKLLIPYNNDQDCIG